jgi:DNA-binding FadR family transcriptional regulator
MFEPAKRVRAYESVVSQLEQRILRGHLEPGSRLPAERSLMEEFQVSRATIREALRVAESMGLIEVRHSNQGGPMVTAEPFRGVSRAFESLLVTEVGSLADLVELRMVVEGTAALLAASRPKSALRRLERAFDDMLTAETVEAFAEADVDFHLKTAEAGGNPALTLVITALRGPMIESVKVPFSRIGSDTGRGLTLRRHEELLKAIQSGDGPLARAWSHRGLFDSFAPEVSASERRRLHLVLESDGGAELPSTELTEPPGK